MILRGIFLQLLMESADHLSFHARALRPYQACCI